MEYRFHPGDRVTFKLPDGVQETGRVLTAREGRYRAPSGNAIMIYRVKCDGRRWPLTVTSAGLDIAPADAS